MDIELILVPYDSGHENFRSGTGPAHFVDRGLGRQLCNDGHRVQVSAVAAAECPATEIGTTFAVNRRLAGSVRAAVGARRFPIVLSGNCNSCIGTIAGLDAGRLAIVWLDAHGDFNTPETTTTGFLDGMGLAMAAGRCWKALLDTIPGFRAVAVDRIVHVGAQDLDAAEREMFATTGIPLLATDPGSLSGLTLAFDRVLAGLPAGVNGIYLHVDMDCVETACGRSNHFQVTGGLPLSAVQAVIAAIRKRLPITGCTIASYNPAFDEQDNVLSAGIAIVRSIAGTACRS